MNMIIGETRRIDEVAAGFAIAGVKAGWIASAP
jgi:hypothetical protein